MAQLYPDIDTIKKLHQPPTEGEHYLLTFLSLHLSNEYEVYYHPFINGDRPDIVVLKQNGGAIIIAVKDWMLDKYNIEGNHWRLIEDNSLVKSPLSQVQEYRDNLFNLHIDRLLSRSIQNKFYNVLISTVVYFHYTTTTKIQDAISDTGYTACWGNDSLTPDNLHHYLEKVRLNQPSKLFSDDLYQNFKRYLQPPLHMISEGKEIHYTKAQMELTRSESKPRRKIKGIAGSGKTLVLAQRAVNAYIRTQDIVLILTYNLSLKNYIHDRINDVKANFPWNKFYITNYHQFFKTEANNYHLSVKNLSPFSDTGFFAPAADNIKKYKAIFIDEVQDYTTAWLEIITKYFLADDGEFAVFGDEKQNIYNRPLDEQSEPIIKTISGNWNKSLNISGRFTDEIGKLAAAFQKEFLDKRYSVDEIKAMVNPMFDFEQKTLQYYNLGEKANPEDIFKQYIDCVTTYNLHPSNISILSPKIDCLRELDYLIRNKMKEKTTTTFETKEVLDYIRKHKIKQDISIIRRNKKNHFWMKTGTTKLSSIHSYKGWESHTVFLLIEQPEREGQHEAIELIYTGLTRAQVNLFVFNMGNQFYDNFFTKNMSIHNSKTTQP